MGGDGDRYRLPGGRGLGGGLGFGGGGFGGRGIGGGGFGFGRGWNEGSGGRGDYGDWGDWPKRGYLDRSADEVRCWLGNRGAAERLLRDSLLDRFGYLTILGDELLPRPRAHLPPMLPDLLREAPELPDISEDIFAGLDGRFADLLIDQPAYVADSLWSLVRQNPRAARSLLPRFYSGDVLLNPMGLGQLVAFLQGFAAAETGVIEGETVPVFDIMLSEDYDVSFAEGGLKEDKASFSIKVLGIGGTGALVKSFKSSASYGPYGRSCQLQALVDLQWRRYVRHSTDEELYTLKVLPSATAGLKPVLDDDPLYKRVEPRRDRRLEVVGLAGGEPTKIVWEVKSGHRSTFECPVALRQASLSGQMSLTVESASTASFAVTLRHKGGGGYIYGPTAPRAGGGEGAVLLRAGS